VDTGAILCVGLAVIVRFDVIVFTKYTELFKLFVVTEVWTRTDVKFDPSITDEFIVGLGVIEKFNVMLGWETELLGIIEDTGS